MAADEEHNIALRGSYVEARLASWDAELDCLDRGFDIPVGASSSRRGGPQDQDIFGRHKQSPKSLLACAAFYVRSRKLQVVSGRTCVPGDPSLLSRCFAYMSGIPARDTVPTEYREACRLAVRLHYTKGALRVPVKVYDGIVSAYENRKPKSGGR